MTSLIEQLKETLVKDPIEYLGDRPDEDRDEDIMPTNDDPDVSEDEDKGANVEDLKETYN